MLTASVYFGSGPNRRVIRRNKLKLFDYLAVCAVLSQGCRQNGAKYHRAQQLTAYFDLPIGSRFSKKARPIAQVTSVVWPYATDKSGQIHQERSAEFWLAAISVVCSWRGLTEVFEREFPFAIP